MSDGHHAPSGGGSSKGFGNPLGFVAAAAGLLAIFWFFGWLNSDSGSVSVSRLPQGQATHSPVLPAAPACPGTYQSFPLGPAQEVINRGYDCDFSFEVKMGKIKLTGPSGELVVGTGEKARMPTGARYTTWQAVGGNPAVVHAAFCTQGTTWSNIHGRCS